jgi:hypothetical protein
MTTTAEVVHIPNRHVAIQTILKELDRAYEVQMLLIDLIGNIQADDNHRVNYPTMRKAAAARLRESIGRRDAAISVLDAEPPLRPVD